MPQLFSCLHEQCLKEAVSICRYPREVLLQDIPHKMWGMCQGHSSPCASRPKAIPHADYPPLYTTRGNPSRLS